MDSSIQINRNIPTPTNTPGALLTRSLSRFYALLPPHQPILKVTRRYRIKPRVTQDPQQPHNLIPKLLSTHRVMGQYLKVMRLASTRPILPIPRIFRLNTDRSPRSVYPSTIQPRPIDQGCDLGRECLLAFTSRFQVNHTLPMIIMRPHRIHKPAGCPPSPNPVPSFDS